MTSWLRSHLGRVLTHLQICGLFNKSYVEAVNVQNGVKNTGPWKENPGIFFDYMFAPADTADIEQTSNIPQSIRNEDEDLSSAVIDSAAN